VRRGFRLLFLWLLFLIALVGCSNKNEIFKIFQKDRIYEKALVFTKENQLIRSLETKATMAATLLNEVFPKRFRYDKGISFFIGVISDIPLDLSKNITLNRKTPIDVESVEENSTLYKIMPIVNRWSSYYIVTFPPVKDKTFTLELKVDPYGLIKLSFKRLTLRR